MTEPKDTKRPARKRKAKPARATNPLLAKLLPPGIEVTAGDDGKVHIEINPPKSPDNFRSFGGAEHVAANVALMSEVLSMLPDAGTDPWTVGTRVAGAFALLQEMRPADAVEGMLCVQAIALHIMSLEAGRRSHLSGQQSDAAAKLRKDAVNAMRGMTDMLAALDRKRGKGQQHIRVERVERVLVTEGGALIGNIASPAIGQGPAPMALPGGGVEGELKAIG